MRNLSWKKGAGIGLLVVMLLAAVGFAACAAPEPLPPPEPATPTGTPTISVDPGSVELGMALIQTAIVFKGTGWAPNEGIVVEIVGARPGSELGADLPVAQGKADGSGSVEMAMDTIAKISDIFGASWKDNGPDFSAPKPIAPKAYTCRATGVASGATATCTWTLAAPAPKE